MRNHRPVIESAIYRLKVGIPWRHLPAEFGAWQTVHRRHARWSSDGTWDRVLAQLQADARGELDWRAIGRSRGGLTTKTHALVDGKGRALVLIVSPGQAGDSPVLLKLLAELRVARCGPGRPRTTPDVSAGRQDELLARAPQSAALAASRPSSPSALIRPAHRRNRGSRGGRPVSYDVQDYKQCNVLDASSTG